MTTKKRTCGKSSATKASVKKSASKTASTAKKAAPKAVSVKKAAPKAAVAKKAAAPKKVAAKKTVAKKAAVSPEERYCMVQDAAYYIAERHGFNGDSAYFWALAESEIKLQLGE
jgi:hypothetical protein